MNHSRITSYKAVQIISLALAMVTAWLMVTFALGSQTPKPEAVPELKLVTLPERKRLKPRQYLIIKRWMDIGISSILIISLAPLMGLLALGIALDGKGSPIIKLERVGSRVRGKGGRFSWETKGITLYKFRITQAGQEAESANDSQTNSNVTYIFKRGTTLSPINYILRRTRFDNLPTLFNVLKGDISLVGPRPATVEEVEAYGENQLRRFEAPAGMTGWWQVTKPMMKGSNVSLDKMIEQDIWYVENKSLRRDCKILLLTPVVILIRRLYP